jgi:hypothetical protein
MADSASSQVKKLVAASSVISLLIGVTAGVMLAPGKSAAQDAPQEVSSTAPATLPVECRSALNLGNQAFGVALEGIGQGRSAAAASVNAASNRSSTVGVLGEAAARVQNMAQQYNQSRATCLSVAGLSPADGNTSQ